jgi:hypothetical protein
LDYLLAYSSDRRDEEKIRMKILVVGEALIILM